MNTDEIVLGIGEQLRFVLFGLACVLNVEFNPAEVERLFDEGEREISSEAKQYTFYSSSHLAVTGRVAEYEPETVWLKVKNRKPFEPSLSTVAEWAKYQACHIKRRQSEGY